jgi:hypothetical protein
MNQFLFHTKSTIAERCQERPYTIRNLLFCLTFNHSRRAFCTWARCTRRAFSGFWAFHFWATSTRARRALTLWLVAFRAIKNNWLGFRNRRFEDIFAEIWHRRTFTL